MPPTYSKNDYPKEKIDFSQHLPSGNYWITWACPATTHCLILRLDYLLEIVNQCPNYNAPFFLFRRTFNRSQTKKWRCDNDACLFFHIDWQQNLSGRAGCIWKAMPPPLQAIFMDESRKLKLRLKQTKNTGSNLLADSGAEGNAQSLIPGNANVAMLLNETFTPTMLEAPDTFGQNMLTPGETMESYSEHASHIIPNGFNDEVYNEIYAILLNYLQMDASQLVYNILLNYPQMQERGTSFSSFLCEIPILILKALMWLTLTIISVVWFCITVPLSFVDCALWCLCCCHSRKVSMLTIWFRV